MKHGSTKFKEYLLVFLNKILEDGAVPEDLNIGKCVLIFKVFNFRKVTEYIIKTIHFRGAILFCLVSTGPSLSLLIYCAL